MKALRDTLAALVVLGAIVVLSPAAPARVEIIQWPISVVEGGAGGAEDGAYRTPPMLPENPNPADAGEGLIMMTLVWLGLASETANLGEAIGGDLPIASPEVRPTPQANTHPVQPRKLFDLAKALTQSDRMP